MDAPLNNTETQETAFIAGAIITILCGVCDFIDQQFRDVLTSSASSPWITGQDPISEAPPC